jgi:hypothetical protein
MLFMVWRCIYRDIWDWAMNTFVILCDNTMAITMTLCVNYCEINHDCANAIITLPALVDDVLC